MTQDFQIDTSIYPGEYIQEAISDFSQVADISFTNTTLSITSDDNREEVFNEFMNYVLSLINQ